MKIRKEGDDGWLYTDWESDEKEFGSGCVLMKLEIKRANTCTEKA